MLTIDAQLLTAIAAIITSLSTLIQSLRRRSDGAPPPGVHRPPSAPGRRRQRRWR